MRWRIDRLPNWKAAIAYSCSATVGIFAAYGLILLTGGQPSPSSVAVFLAGFVPVFTALSTWRHHKRRNASLWQPDRRA